MAIAKKPLSNHIKAEKKNAEQAAEAFISGAKQGEVTEEKKGLKIPIMMRFDPIVLDKVDAAARRRGISRSAWIQFTVSRAIDQGEG